MVSVAEDNRFLRTVIESQQGLIVFSLDRNYCYSFFSVSHAQTIERVWGEKISLGRNILDAIKRLENRIKLKANFDRALAGESMVLEEEYLYPDGEHRFYESRYNPIRNEADEVIGLTAFVIDVTRIKQAEKERFEIESAYRILFETTPDAIYIMAAEGDNVGQIISANEAAAIMHGYSPDEFITLNVRDLDSPKENELFQSRLEKILAGEKLSFDVTHKKKDGTTFSLEASVNLISLNGKQYTMSINRDITERKEILMTAQERERFIQRIANSSPDLIYVFDIQKQKSIYTNRPLGEMLGFSPAEIMEMGDNFIATRMHPDNFKMLASQLSRWSSVTDDEVLESEYRMMNKAGEWRWYLSRDTVFKRDASGKVTQIIGTARDRTQSKQNELALKQSEERFKRLQEASFGGVGIHDDGKILDVNQGLADITGYPIEELIGMDGLQLIAPEYREHVIQKIRIGYEEPYDVIGLKKDGSRFHLEIQGKNLPLEDKVVRVTEFRDITGRKQIEESIREQNIRLRDIADNLTRKNEQLEEFTQIVSHNLRAPVGNIVSLLSLYNLEGPAEERNQYIQHSKNSSNLLMGTLNELNEVLKIKQTKNIERQELEFKLVFDKVSQLLSARIAELGASIQCDFCDAPVISYPNIYLESILLNLLSNALKYHAPHRPPVIRIKTYHTAKSTMLEFADNGLGINLEQYGHQIFKMRKTFHDHPESRGIGLFLIKNQIESMGGEISVKSEVNAGTTFYVKLS